MSRDSKPDVSRLRQHRKIRRLPKRRQMNNDKRTGESGIPVSHCSRFNEPLNEDNSDTEVHSLGESVGFDLHSSRAAIVPADAASTQNVCDIFWVNPAECL